MPILPDPCTLPLTPDIAATEWGGIEGQETLKHHAERGTYWARIGSNPECVPLEVVSVVAAVSETHPTELPILYYDIGPDAFEELADLPITDASLGELSTSVTYAGYEVTVHADGVVCIRPPPEESSEEQ